MCKVAKNKEMKIYFLMCITEMPGSYYPSLRDRLNKPEAITED